MALFFLHRIIVRLHVTSLLTRDPSDTTRGNTGKAGHKSCSSSLPFLFFFLLHPHHHTHLFFLMSYPYSSSYHCSSSPSLPGAWSSEWSLPEQNREYEMGLEVAEINRFVCSPWYKALALSHLSEGVGDDPEALSSSNSVDLDCPEVHLLAFLYWHY